MIFYGYEGKPGEKAWVEIPVPDAKPIEAMLCCGMQEGKTLVVTAGVHSCEYVGIEAVRRLAEELDPAQMCGNVILLSLVNAEGFFQGAASGTPAVTFGTRNEKGSDNAAGNDFAGKWVMAEFIRTAKGWILGSNLPPHVPAAVGDEYQIMLGQL